MSHRLLVALMVAAAGNACGASGDAISLPDETPTDGGDESASASVDADAAPDLEELSPPDDLDAACRACIDASLSWGEDGELWDETSTLRPCHAYTHTRQAFAGRASASCADEFVACEGTSALTPGLLARALADPYVQTALADDGPTLYGRDSRLVDGVVFRMVIDGKEIVLGACAADDEHCVEPGVASLANLLRSIDDDLLRRPACSAAFATD